MAAALQCLNRLVNGETGSNGSTRGATSYPGDHHDDDAVGMCSYQAVQVVIKVSFASGQVKYINNISRAVFRNRQRLEG